MTTIRVLVADGHTVVRVGLRALVGAEPGMELVGEAADGPEAVRLAAELDPDVVVVELTLPGMTGAELATRLCAGRLGRRVLALTACEEKAPLRALMDAGAGGCVFKRASADELVRAIRTVAAGAAHLDPVIDLGTANGAVRAAGAELSEREREVVRLIALGYSNKEIAARFKLSVKTVETYKTRSMEKLGIRGRVDIVRYAAARGWLTTDPHGVPPAPPPDPVTAPAAVVGPLI